MTKPNKLFSWLGFGKKPAADSQPATTPAAATETPVETSASQTTATELAQQPAVSATPELQPEMTTPAEAQPVISKPAETQPAMAEMALEVAVEAPVHVEPTVTASDVTMPVATTSTIDAPVVTEVVTAPIEAVVATVALPRESVAESAVSQPTAPSAEKKLGFFARLKQGLSKTSQNLGNGLASLFLGKKIDDDLYEELETQLLMADVGVETSQKLIKQLVQHADRRQLKDADSLYEKLQQEMAQLLDVVEKPLHVDNPDGPFVILMVGVNGVGKTTTIGKMAQQFKQQGKSVMLAAGDTFRAAAVEQLQVWGERNQIPVIAQHSGADSASVIFDAYQAAKARKIDVLIADTAGRLQNKAHLMEELKKIVRVMKKIDGAAPHEVMLTLDAGTGQNALSQAKLFHEAVELTGISLTKLDGTAKGGVIFAIADQFKLPIRYIGVGESIDDLRVFNSKDFIRALFNKEF
jgi:fused signal recognition particle receptor